MIGLNTWLIFFITIKLPLEFSRESKATPCPPSFDWTHKGVLDETKVPPKLSRRPKFALDSRADVNSF